MTLPRTTGAEHRAAASIVLGARRGAGPEACRGSVFDPIQRSDSFQCLVRYRRSMGLFQIVEVTPHMRPARGRLNAAILVELIEARIGIRLQRTAKLFQMLRWMFAFAIR